MDLCVCVSVCWRVCVNKIPASKVQWPGTDENPLGESLLDVSPLPPPGIFSSWQRSDGEVGGRGAQNHVSGEMNRAAVPSVSHKLGSGRSHGTPLKDEQREEGRKQLFSVFLLLLQQLTRVFVPSLWSSLRLSLASVMLFFFFFLVGLFLKEETL